MAQDEKLTRERLSALWSDQSVPQLNTKDRKIVLFSDLHVGGGGKADDFRNNQGVFERALDHYRKNDFTVVLLGDIEELWQFDLKEIVKKYDSGVYRRLRAFPKDRFYRVHGNHDAEWGTPDDPARQTDGSIGAATEALKLKDKKGQARILLVHGHQGSSESDKHSWASRFFVRLYRKIEPIIKVDPHSSATKSQIAKDYERILYRWAKKSRVILICGHSHRAIFASISYVEKLEEEIRKIQKVIFENRENKPLVKKEMKKLEKVFAKKLHEETRNRGIVRVEPRGKPLPCYFNTGCGLYTDGLTAIEIEDDEIRLVKWNRELKRRDRKEDFGKGSLSKFVNDIS